MKKFKDFLYDKNDIIIALLILVIASLLIIWRMEAIMEYPKTLISDTESTSTELDSATDEGQTQDPAAGDTSDQGSSDQDAQDGDGPDSSQSDTGGTSALWSNGVLSRDVEVKVSGSSAAEAVECLVAAGLFDDYADYQSACTSAGLDHQKVSAGTFTFTKGSAKTDIAKAVNWS